MHFRTFQPPLVRRCCAASALFVACAAGCQKQAPTPVVETVPAVSPAAPTPNTNPPPGPTTPAEKHYNEEVAKLRQLEQRRNAVEEDYNRAIAEAYKPVTDYQKTAAGVSATSAEAGDKVFSDAYKLLKKREDELKKQAEADLAKIKTQFAGTLKQIDADIEKQRARVLSALEKKDQPSKP